MHEEQWLDLYMSGKNQIAEVSLAKWPDKNYTYI